MFTDKIQLTEEENKILVDICKVSHLTYTMLYFNLLSKDIRIKHISLSDENTAILLDLLTRIPGFDADGDAVIIFINVSRQKASLMYGTHIIAEY